jgi:hypothetical protein
MGITRVGCIDLASLYRCPNLRVEGRSVYTNNPIAGAFRGYGAVQAFFALDVQMDEIAERLGLDPVDVRLKNAIGLGDSGPSGHHLPGDSLAACLRRGAEEVGWYQRKQRPQPAAESGDFGKKRRERRFRGAQPALVSDLARHFHGEPESARRLARPSLVQVASVRAVERGVDLDAGQDARISRKLRAFCRKRRPEGARQ